ncbi:hypothetical protein GDO81_027491 [Engystomops pustulosus]|uniref:Ig-like domain-containing protein n=1 Tax=Engystomops pustulosus TaxID=76066 RepID=A0AAV6ZLR3_ENGPU|nr:hypothetical protein GDO81_027491 [Engystomops pustulosus]KAG8550216.1 hypothetical protein GDO81_027491 [Engystomops pustulosus]
MEALQQLYLLLICQGFYLGSVCQWWTFPSRITALLGSCVEIPCRYHGHTSGTVWYLYRFTGFTEILNTKDSSSVMEKYRYRTSLVPGDKSCTLRIDPVTWEDGGGYYPGIYRSINALKTQYKYLSLSVTDKVDIQLLVSDIMTEGEATTTRCAVYHTCGSSPPDLQWNKPGHVIKKSVHLTDGLWREESALTYTPSYEDDGSSVQCKVQYINNIFRVTSGILNIKYAPKNVTITVIGVDEVMEGSDVTLQCNSVSRPDVSEYEWYKGETRLPDREREMTVRNVTRDMEPYSCAARNSVGRRESAPLQIPVIYEKVDLRQILGITAGVFVVMFLILWICLRWNKKSAPPVNGTVSTRSPPSGQVTRNENQYGNIQTNPKPQPIYMKSETSVDVNVGENHVIYSNGEVRQPSNDVEYSVISHRQQDQTGPTTCRANNADLVEYATLKH